MKTFKRESTFMNHKCKEMIRLETIQTINGQQAYQFYKRWLLKCRKSTQTIEAFLNSTYFNAMLRFVDFCKSHNILDPIAYIDKMVELKISPSLWDRQEASAGETDHRSRCGFIQRRCCPWCIYLRLRS
jgi:hypothetical protein